MSDRQDLSDAPVLTDTQRRTLTALLDTILPASPDGRMPSAAELDFTAHLKAQAPTYLEDLPAILDRFDPVFPDLPPAARLALVDTFAATDAETFDALLFRVYDCYYQNDLIRTLIGGEPGPPFPRGNTIPAGDLSGLDAVIARSKGYRRVP